MSASLNDRFSRLAALRPAPTKSGPARRREAFATPSDGDDLAQLLGAVVARNRYGEHLVVRRWYSAPEPCAPTPHGLSLVLPRKPGQTAAAHERIADPTEWLFLDTETTGLAGGTGTYAFLVGIAWWEAGGLQVEQFLMRDYSEEHSLLLELSRRLAERRVLVTFNGKSFDWPLLETRYLMTRAIAPRPPATHLDLLHPARQLWRLRLGSVRLTELEQHVLGADRLGWDRRDDIDSALIPQVYFDYLRGGPPERLISVLRHNQMDLRGLAALAGRVFTLLAEPEAAGGQETHALELYGLSRLLDRRGEPSKARLLYERALGAGLPTAVDRAARRELARLAKRERDFARAISLWEELLDDSFHRRVSPAPDFGKRAGAASRAPIAGVSVDGVILSPPRRTKDLSGGILRPDWVGAQNDTHNSLDALEAALEAYEQLAIYYEHHAREHSRAAALTRQALAKLRTGLRAGGVEPGRYRRWQTRLAHRLARLTRKRDRPLLDLASAEARGNPRESN